MIGLWSTDTCGVPSEPLPAPAAEPASSAFAKVFRRARERRGLTQTEAGAELGVSQQTVANWEAPGMARPQRRLWPRVADFVSLPLGDLRPLMSQRSDEAVVVPLPPVNGAASQSISTLGLAELRTMQANLLRLGTDHLVSQDMSDSQAVLVVRLLEQIDQLISEATA